MSEVPKPAMQAALTFREMLAADAHEVERWHKHFQNYPALFTHPTSISGAGTLGKLVQHIAAVQYMYSRWLLELPLPDPNTLPADMEGVFRLAAEARMNLSQFIDDATPEELAKIIEFHRGDFHLRCTRRKGFVQAILHGDRHWAQIAVAVREAGRPTDWIHDFVFSPAME